jgi:hypothetical protein
MEMLVVPYVVVLALSLLWMVVWQLFWPHQVADSDALVCQLKFLVVVKEDL